jgi:hypothetical protein
MRRFPADIAVIRDSDGIGLIIAGDADNVNAIDADDGDEVAIYRLSGIKRFRRDARLEEMPSRRKDG